MGKCKVQSGNDFYDEILNNRKKLRRYMIYDIWYMWSTKKNKTAIEGKNLNL